MRTTSLLLLFLLSSLSAFAQPQRKAIMGLLGKESPSGILVDSILPNTTLASAGLKKGDLLTELNNKALKKMADYNALASLVRNGDKVNVRYQRDGASNFRTITAVMRPFESSPIADIQYDWVKFKGGYLRAITRKPKGKSNVPCILLIPGYGCGSIENYSTSYNGKLMNEWLKNGYAVVTIEKSGLGDSDGCAPCAEVDLATDIESFDAGYRYMEQLPFVDKSNLFIWGHSMGGTIAPEVAKRHTPRGVMVFACVFRPWSEFLLEMHRVQKPLMENLSYQQTETFVRLIQKVYYELFVLKKNPTQLHEVPEYKAIVESELNYQPGSNNMWGRHWRFWQQLDSVNLAESWRQTNCPVLILHGGADYEQCSLVEPLMIQKTVNEAHPNTATWVTIPDLDHFMMKSKDWTEAYQNFKTQQYTKGNFNPKIAEETLSWLGKLRP
ncbi:alpha/beta fold hydrolase [Haliscomenobacter sp.]|uniref:alpha/beta fold hydrolase n=1 Tax=Haliscomenobacter sp. TaxID=2717303 RepID=UPI003BAAB58E